MSSIAQRLVSQTAIYGISSIVGRVLTYLLVPVYTAVFAAAEYGIVTGLYAYVAFLNVVFTYGMETTFFRFANRPGADRRLLYNQLLSLLLLTSAVGTGLLAWAARPLLGLLDVPAGHERYAVWVALILGLDALTALPFARLRLDVFRYFFLQSDVQGAFANYTNTWLGADRQGRATHVFGSGQFIWAFGFNAPL